MTRQVYILHGSSPDWHPGLQTMKHYVPELSLKAYLDERSERFVDPEESEEGDILTVDDSTIGGFETCMIARERGHAITLFLNPSQIQSGRDYWFSRFDALVDHRKAEKVHFAGKEYDLRSREELRRFRFAVRPSLLGATEDCAHRSLDEIEILLQAEGAIIPRHARSIAMEQVLALADAGVRIGNHGWDHQCLSGLSPAEQSDDLVSARKWLRQVTGQMVADYAVPFGLQRLQPDARSAVPGLIYLVDPELAPEAAGPGYRYRRNLSPMLQQLTR